MLDRITLNELRYLDSRTIRISIALEREADYLQENFAKFYRVRQTERRIYFKPCAIRVLRLLNGCREECIIDACVRD